MLGIEKFPHSMCIVMDAPPRILELFDALLDTFANFLQLSKMVSTVEIRNSELCYQHSKKDQRRARHQRHVFKPNALDDGAWLTPNATAVARPETNSANRRILFFNVNVFDDLGNTYATR